MSPGICRSELLHTHAERFSRALRGLEQGDVRALHRARVATRRLREILPVLCINGVTNKLVRRLKKTTSRLGGVRELDVLLQLIDELHDSRREHAPALGRVAIAVAKARDDARERLLFGRLPVRELRRTARKLDDIVEDLAGQPELPEKALRSTVDARVARRAHRLAMAMRDAGAVYLAERLHAVRIAVKKLRYSAELASEITESDLKPEVRALRAAQDVLGRMHDLQILIDRVRQVQATLAPPSVNVWRTLDALQQSLDDDCRRLHARYMRARPKLELIADRLSAIAPGSAAAAPARTRAKRGAATPHERWSKRAG
jgi:CHAD domain-containing protein